MNASHVVDIVQWLLTGIFAVLCLWAVIFNYVVIVLKVIARRKKAPSLAPFFGGVSGSLAVLACPVPGVFQFWWIPIVADPGCWYSLYAVVLLCIERAKEESITLHHVEREDITIDIVARFDDGDLIIDGYDIGKTVKECWGDSDYEYVMTIPAASLPGLYALLNVQVGNRRALLKALAKRFHGNKCYSAIGDFLDKNSIDYKSFSWT